MPGRASPSGARAVLAESLEKEPDMKNLQSEKQESPLKNESKLTIGEDADRGCDKPGESLRRNCGHLLTATANICDLEAANSGHIQSSEELKYETVFLSCL